MQNLDILFHGLENGGGENADHFKLSLLRHYPTISQECTESRISSRDRAQGIIPIMKIHRDVESRKILNLVFVWANEEIELKVDVPIVFKGEDDFLGIKKECQIYKEKLADRTLVAIKSLKMRKKHSPQAYTPQIEMISKLRHKHLVSGLGHYFQCCLDDSSVSIIYLIFEFVPNGTLRDCICAISKWLQSSSLQSLLDCKQANCDTSRDYFWCRYVKCIKWKIEVKGENIISIIKDEDWNAKSKQVVDYGNVVALPGLIDV
ncbi:hypothetical protein PTKIN_Ptkin15bG0134500 [Pterospermum kingtungense]